MRLVIPAIPNNARLDQRTLQSPTPFVPDGNLNVGTELVSRLHAQALGRWFESSGRLGRQETRPSSSVRGAPVNAAGLEAPARNRPAPARSAAGDAPRAGFCAAGDGARRALH